MIGKNILRVLGMFIFVITGCSTLSTVDLAPYCNGVLEDGWHPETRFYQNPTDNNLAELPQGKATLSGTRFDIDGVIQLAGSARPELNDTFPDAVTNILINRKVGRFVFLHGTGWQTSEGTTIGSYDIHYASGRSRQFPIIYGQTVRDWWFWPQEPENATDSELAWMGSNPATKRAGMMLRLYKSSFENPLPKEKVTSLDFKSTMTACAPFLIAITIEKP